MRWTTAVIVAALGLSSCTAASHERYSDISDVAESPTQHFLHLAGRPGDVTQRDRNFVYRATVHCLYDLELAQLAQERATNPAVRDFARGVTNECRAQDRQLAVVAEEHVGVTPPVTLDRAHAAMRDQIAALSGEAFDRAYARDQIAATDRAAQLFLTQSGSGSEPVLQRLAAAALPGLQQRQRAAHELEGQLSN